MSISKACLLRHLYEDELLLLEEMEEKTALIWEGNYWDGVCHDYAELSWSTVAVVVAKIAKILQKYCEKKDKVLILLPNIIQLPLIVLAAERLQLISILVDPSCPQKENTLIDLFNETTIKLIITVDGFWQGDHLHQTKQNIDRILSENSLCVNNMIVIRHCAANDGIPPPEIEFPGRRPSYQLKLLLTEGRDEEWSQLFRKISDSTHDVVDFFHKLKEDDDEQADDRIIAILADRKANALNMEMVSQAQLTSSLENLKNIELKNNFPEQMVILAVGHPSKSLFNFISTFYPWYTGNTLVQYEGHVSFPDPSRISHIIKKYKVETLLISSDVSLDPNYLSIVPTSSLLNVVVGGSDDVDNDFQTQLQLQILKSAFHKIIIETISL
ncbi:unnamed protein product [Auanema sp. JU1783]|nr:unnamed protein product [Auanema sp. JU1783]